MSLVQAVWPWVNTWLDWFKAHNEKEGEKEGKKGRDRDQNKDQNKLAAQGFLQLLDQLCIILLQDSVLLRSSRAILYGKIQSLYGKTIRNS
jgi:hypothetical protein